MASSIAENLQHVERRIGDACATAGRPVQSVTLLAVSKTFPAEAVRQAHACGQRAFGENYVQEGLEKIAALADLRPGLEWHLIGPLQSNKTRAVAEAFDWVHSVDRLKIAERLSLVREQLPRGVNPQMGPVSSIMGEIMLVAVTAERASPMEVREIADFIIRPQILNIAGVSQVIPIGGEVRQYRITPDIAAMQALDVTPEQIEAAVTRFGTNTGGGFIDQQGREYLIRNVGLTQRLEDLR